MPTQLPHDRPIRWGILGAGGIAATVGADIAASRDSELLAIGARDADRAQAFAEKLSIPRSYGSYAELVADPDVDVIYVATTHGQHYEHALLCLEAGKPVLVEKAFTLNVAQAREVVELARARDLFCMEAMWMRLNPLVIKARQAVADGRIGDVLSIHGDFAIHVPFDPASRLYDMHVGGGALLDLGVYPATFAWLFLGRPIAIQTTGRLSPTGSDATAAMQWSYDDGRYAHVTCSVEGVSPSTGLILGTDGWVAVAGPIFRPSALTIVTSEGEETLPDRLPGNGYGPEVSEVERCLRAGVAESEQIPLDDTIEILGILDEARRQLGVRYRADG